MACVVLCALALGATSPRPTVRSKAMDVFRPALAGGALVASLLLGGPQPAFSAPCVDESNPSYTIRHCKNVGFQPDGRLGRCSSNSNCVSTSSVSSPQHFSPPWSFKSAATDDSISERDVRVSWRLLNDAIASTPGLTIVESDDAALYLRAESPSSVPPTSVDDLEFALRRSDGLVTYKSETRDTVFVYPLQRPVGCNDCHKKRLAELRTRLGWDDLSETYSGGSAGLADADGGAVGADQPEVTLGRFVPLF
ncbi:hypothetical protein KFE25_013013 [Diacronema lutheri]|uniref:Uncharacterized protein n=2 Tax=Diacronema lutheri TaxID=2081491 RepID=A0A8J5XEM8_DIALT|nr:hypothetical protein KFE25_013013 [Diacronema lutheri]